MLPSILTNLVFACLVLGQQLPTIREVARLAGPQLAFGQMLAFGQYAATSLLAAAWFEKSYNVSGTFAAVVPLGFEGGHGVVAGFKEVLDVDNPDGYQQGMVAATVGLLVGTVTGWAMVNWGYNKGKLAALKPQSASAAAPAATQASSSVEVAAAAGANSGGGSSSGSMSPARLLSSASSMDPLLGRETPGLESGNTISGGSSSSSSRGSRNTDNPPPTGPGAAYGSCSTVVGGNGGNSGSASSGSSADGGGVLAGPGPRARASTPANVQPALDWKHTGVYKVGERPVAGFQTVATESLDSLAMHLSMVGLALGLGWLLKTCTLQIQAAAGGWLEEVDFFGSFPLFPFTLGSAVAVQAVLDRLGPNTALALDRSTMNRISGTCMDFLVLSAIATLDFSSLSSAYVPFFLSCAFVSLWSLVALFMFGPLMPDMWLERATIEVGLSCGATATALLVLRMVDPHSDTILLKAFCYKQIAHVCIVGGGLFTSSSVTILRAAGSWTLFGISITMVLVWFGVLYSCSGRAPRWWNCCARRAGGRYTTLKG